MINYLNLRKKFLKLLTDSVRLFIVLRYIFIDIYMYFYLLIYLCILTEKVQTCPFDPELDKEMSMWAPEDRQCPLKLKGFYWAVLARRLWRVNCCIVYRESHVKLLYLGLKKLTTHATVGCIDTLCAGWTSRRNPSPKKLGDRRRWYSSRREMPGKYTNCCISTVMYLYCTCTCITL